MPNEIVLNVKVIPNSKEFKVTGYDPLTQTLKAKVKAKPSKGLANKELEEKLSEFFSSKTKIIFGTKNNKKKILVQDAQKALNQIKNL